MSGRETIIAGRPFPPYSNRSQRQRSRELRQKLVAKYADEISRSSFLGRIAIWFRIQREIWRELNSGRRSPYAI